jgi:hypothetical protein
MIIDLKEIQRFRQSLEVFQIINVFNPSFLRYNVRRIDMMMIR